MLGKEGVNVTPAENGLIGYEIATSAWKAGNPFDVILMDIEMPIMDCFIATRKLRDDGYTGTIIAVTALDSEDDRKKCLEAGCDDFIAKPIDKHEFIQLIRNHLIRHGNILQ